MADALVPIRQAVPIGSITFVHRSRAPRNQPSQQEAIKNQQPTSSLRIPTGPIYLDTFYPIRDVVLRYYWLTLSSRHELKNEGFIKEGINVNN